MIEQHRQPQAEREFADGREERIDDGELDRGPEYPVAEQRIVVLPADEEPRAPDPRVGEAEPDAKPERIGQEKQQQAGRRQHEQKHQEPAIVEQPQKAVLPRPPIGRLGYCRHDPPSRSVSHLLM
jgi:hypothetical protein